MLSFLKAVTALFCAAFAIVAPEAPTNDVKVVQGKPLPPFEMTALNGKKINNASLKGRPAVIDFWATWCGPCKKASPVMQSLHKKFGQQGLLVIGADGFEQTPGAGPAKAYAKEHKYDYLFTHSNDKLMAEWGINGVPTIIFVDRTGKVAKVQVGFDDSLKDEFFKVTSTLMKK
jgi:thiol-disulfide isomerase/thioredoxin